MISSLAFATEPPAAPSSEQEKTGLADTYATFAGSRSNAQALIEGLFNGTRGTLVMPTSPTTRAAQSTFAPRTGKLGYDNIRMALALAQAALLKVGITQPTAGQIEAVLNGGAIMAPDGPAQTPGVLALRSQGQVWGNISKALGVKLAADGSVAAATSP
ncbi:hypothetical protein [Dyella amyloliquefaciens]|uniref:hypothetical protein n=1 Tax=Dyella amyloliquefaciens TaxID=1770545 RepID=UPI00102E2857|nr:hypothetical protein [Dyella amyloliquefaciens]